MTLTETTKSPESGAALPVPARATPELSSPEPPQPARRRTGAAVGSGLRWLARAMASPLVPADYLDLFDPLRPGAELRAKVVSITPETADAVTLELRPGADWRGHRPGQFVRLGIEVDGVRHWRAYSITSRVTDPTITITVKAIADGRVSNHLVRTARPGAIVQLSQAEGEFGLGDPMPQRVLFVTAGSGITPVLGMLANHASELGDVVLVHSAPDADQSIARTRLLEYAAAPGFRLIERHTDRDGLLGVEELEALVPDWAGRQTWACGPVGMLDALEQHWADHGLGDALHTERFRPSAPVVIGDGGTVRFSRTDASAEAAADESLLAVGEQAGVLMPAGCRLGICRGCVLPLTSGAVRDLRTGEVTEGSTDDRPLVQTCISAAASDCELDV